MNLIRYGEKFFDELEIQKIWKNEVSSSVELNQISSASSERIERTVIRGVKDGKAGIYLVDSTKDEDILKGIEKAAMIAKVNDPDPHWPGLPEAQSYRADTLEVPEQKSPEHFVNILSSVLKEVKLKDPKAMVVGGESGGAWLRTEILNSNGVSVEQNDFTSFFVLVMIGRQGAQVTPSIFDIDVSKTHEVDTKRVVDSCIKKIKVANTVKKAELREAPVLMEPFALSELLMFALFPAFNGEREVKGTSVLAGKEGESIMSKKVSIYDDPLNPNAVSHVIADDEGVATRKTSLVEHGVMRGFLWNHYWASIAGRESTGNGLRSFRTGAMSIGAHNMVVAPGTRSLEDIISDMKKGYIVSSYQGAHSSNPDTGDFAVVANPAFVVEDGEIVGSTVFMLSGNVYDIMNNVAEVSKELRSVYMGMLGKGQYPAIKFENLKIAPVSR
ncbi:MAG: TldD/PmbA family protein [Euryarchaeota archaeon]|nr:TldD/PmbA family protein [Euryarchaeota archaeon]